MVLPAAARAILLTAAKSPATKKIVAAVASAIFAKLIDEMRDNPRRFARSKEKKRRVLQDLIDLGWMSEEDADEAANGF